MLFNPLIEQAIELSAQWHDRTYRKSRWRDPAFEVPPTEVLKVPVMAHVTAVALTVQRAGWDDVTVAAAFLHDTVEDVNQYGQALRREQLRTMLGENIATLVMEVTEEKYDEQGKPNNWPTRKQVYVKNLENGSPEAAAISLADKLHNLWSMNNALSRGMDIFSTCKHRKAMSAGPERQLWFFNAVFLASQAHSDERLLPMQTELKREIDRFVELTGVIDGG